MHDRDYILGPIKDSDALLERYRQKVDQKAERKDLFIEYEEGKSLFPHLDCWQNPKNFPALRVDMDNPAHQCKFLGKFLGDDKLCTIHEIRS